MSQTDIVRSLTGTRDQPVLNFEREYAFAPDELWSACTDPERLQRWFGTFAGPTPGAVGDSFEIDLGGGSDDTARGRVTACEPPHRLGYDWQWQDERPSRVEVTLEPGGRGTILRLRHTLGESDHVVGYGGGWEQMLLALHDDLSGSSTPAETHHATEEAGNQAWRALQDAASRPH